MGALAKNNHHGYSSISLPDGRKLAYSEYGDRHGKPVIYFHGFPGSRVEGLLMDAAAKWLGLRIVAPDRPGFGRSDFQAGRRDDCPGQRGLRDLRHAQGGYREEEHQPRRGSQGYERHTGKMPNRKEGVDRWKTQQPADRHGHFPVS